MSSAMRILYVIDHLHGGGAEQQFVHIANNFQGKKLIYLTQDKGVRRKEIDINVAVFGGYGRKQPLRAIIQIKRLVKEFRPDVIHSFLMYSCFVCALALQTSRQRPLFLCQEFSSPEQILREVKFYSLKKYLIKWTYAMADRLIVSSYAVKEEITKEKYINPLKVCVIPEGISLSKCRSILSKEEIRRELGFRKGCVYIIFVGSLVKRKGVVYLIKAFMDIKNENLKLLIIGEGEMKLELQRISCDHRIAFLGYRENALEYIKAADMLVLPSFYEGFPNVLLEAMAVGTPVIATNVSGIPELIQDGVGGALIPPGNAYAIKKAIECFATDIQLAGRLSEYSLEKVKSYDIEAMRQAYENLYTELFVKLL